VPLSGKAIESRRVEFSARLIYFWRHHLSYKTDAEIEAIVSDFEACQTGKDDFHHREHLVVAAYYLQASTIEAATERLRNSLCRFLQHHEIDPQKYNETLTVFWLEMVAMELAKLRRNVSLVDKCNSVAAALNNPKLVDEFYSDDLLWSEKARKSFVAPDLKPFDTL